MMEPLVIPFNTAWPFWRRWGLLFLVCYCCQLFLDFTSSDTIFPAFLYKLFAWYVKIWNWLIPWIGLRVLHLKEPITIFPNGSGDTTYNYVMQPAWMIIALVLSLAWAVLDRKRPGYDRLAYWLRTAMRYYLAYCMCTYGAVKVIKLQFPEPSLVTLSTPLGNLSPMSLAWTFVGFSHGYNLFIGAAEMMAGILLFFRRTTLLGAVMTIGVMSNVVVMNLTYDIPVKIYSMNLLFLAVYLAAYDWRRLLNVFLLDRPATASRPQVVTLQGWKRLAGLGFKVLFIGITLYSTLYKSWEQSFVYGDAAPKPAMVGLYKIEQFTPGADSASQRLVSQPWKELVIAYNNYALIRVGDGEEAWVKFKADTLQRQLTLINPADTVHPLLLHYTKTPEGRFVFESTALRMQCSCRQAADYNLMNRGFHWVNEYPYN